MNIIIHTSFHNPKALNRAIDTIYNVLLLPLHQYSLCTYYVCMLYVWALWEVFCH